MYLSLWALQGLGTTTPKVELLSISRILYLPVSILPEAEIRYLQFLQYRVLISAHSFSTLLFYICSVLFGQCIRMGKSTPLSWWWISESDFGGLFYWRTPLACIYPRILICSSRLGLCATDEGWTLIIEGVRILFLHNRSLVKTLHWVYHTCKFRNKIWERWKIRKCFGHWMFCSEVSIKKLTKTTALICFCSAMKINKLEIYYESF